MHANLAGSYGLADAVGEQEVLAQLGIIGGDAELVLYAADAITHVVTMHVQLLGYHRDAALVHEVRVQEPVIVRARCGVLAGDVVDNRSCMIVSGMLV